MTIVEERSVASGDFLNYNRNRRVICLPGYSAVHEIVDPSTPLRLCTQRRFRPWRTHFASVQQKETQKSYRN